MADTYTVTNQRKTTEVQSGSFIDVMEITFRTNNGRTSDVRIPTAQLTPERADAEIRRAVAVMDAIDNL